jgi:GNAT superfamily N-acetyltransferase
VKTTARATPRIVRAAPAVARKQADWIVGIEPWKGLGYRPSPLGRYLARQARTGDVWIARDGARAPAGIIVATDGFLLGGFIGLLAVRPEASGKGIGQLLVGHVEARVFDRRRWLFVSCDAANVAALRFYRRQGFARVGRLPDLVQAGRIELLLRKGRSRDRAKKTGKFGAARG